VRQLKTVSGRNAFGQLLRIFVCREKDISNFVIGSVTVLHFAWKQDSNVPGRKPLIPH
jgi:hypothetical protein